MSTHLCSKIFSSHYLTSQQLINMAVDNKLEFIDTIDGYTFRILDKDGNCSDGGSILPDGKITIINGCLFSPSNFKCSHPMNMKIRNPNAVL